MSKSAGVLLSSEIADGAGSHMNSQVQVSQSVSQVSLVGQLALHQILPILCLGLWYKPQILLLVMMLALMRFSLVGQLALRQILRIHCLELLPKPQILNPNFKETIDLDNEDINDNAYEASSEGLLSDDESSDNESDNENESSTCINKRSENVVPIHNVLSDIESNANMEIGTENVVPSTNSASSGNSVSPGSSLCGLSVSSGGRSLYSKLPVAVGKGSGSSISAKIPRASGAGVHKTGSSRTAGRSAGFA